MTCSPLCPAATAPDCAAGLTQAFRERLQETDVQYPPTLSVGIAVGHVIEPMSILLGLAREAEWAAKNAGRDALAIIVDKRSGGQRQFAWSWGHDPLARLRRDAELLDTSLATGKVHELEALLRRFPDADAAKARPESAQALAVYANDILSHTGEGKGASLADLVSDLGEDFGRDYPNLRRALAAAIDRILVVRSLREWGFA
jgi:CRISPR-associated protein Cmr2